MTNHPIFATRLIAAVSLIGVVLFAEVANGQNDQVYPLTGRVVFGAVTQTSAQGVQLTRGGSTQNFVAGEIRKILFEGDPPALTRGREFAIDGQHDQALQEFGSLDIEKLPRAVIKADAAFYTAFSQSQLALSGQGDRKAAAAAMLSFASKYRDSWHFFHAAKVLGDLALALGNSEEALKFYGSLRGAPSPTTKIESVYYTGLTHLRAGRIDAAVTEFDKVIGLSVDSLPAIRLQALAKAGKAAAFASQDQPDEGLKLVSLLVAEMSPTDVELAAQIYNAQGANYLAKGDNEGAIIAFLHTHLMFSSQSDAHAVALTKLAELWPKVGKAQRGAEARNELKQRYPGFSQ